MKYIYMQEGIIVPTIINKVTIQKNYRQGIIYLVADTVADELIASTKAFDTKDFKDYLEAEE